MGGRGLQGAAQARHSFGLGSSCSGVGASLDVDPLLQRLHSKQVVVSVATIVLVVHHGGGTVRMWQGSVDGVTPPKTQVEE